MHRTVIQIYSCAGGERTCETREARHNQQAMQRHAVLHGRWVLRSVRQVRGEGGGGPVREGRARPL